MEPVAAAEMKLLTKASVTAVLLVSEMHSTSNTTIFFDKGSRRLDRIPRCPTLLTSLFTLFTSLKSFAAMKMLEHAHTDKPSLRLSFSLSLLSLSGKLFAHIHALALTHDASSQHQW